MKISMLGLLALAAFAPISVQAVYVCTDDNGRTSVQDRPCPERRTSTTNVPVRASELSDSNAIETVNRFYKAMSERDPMAASRFLADTFTSEVRSRNKPPVTDDKNSLTAGLQQVLSAAKTYSAKTKCRVANKTAVVYSLFCQVDEQGIVMNQPHRTASDQTITIVLNDGVVRIARIVSEERE